MAIRKLNIKSKKGAEIGINKMIGIILVILVIVVVLIFLFRANLSKWLGFIPDFGNKEEGNLCQMDSSCKVTSADCFCKTKAGAYIVCETGQYCYPINGCIKEELPTYVGKQECKK